jgi:ArsR family metal-binding transcriptional regulator
MDHILEQRIYLSAASRARKFVDSKMDIGSSNQLSNAYKFGTVQMCVAESRGQAMKELKSRSTAFLKAGGDPYGDDGLKIRVDTVADWAKHYGCGNCGEQSALAFVYLRDVEHL